MPENADPMSALREAAETIGFLRSVIRSGERLDAAADARIDATLAALRASLVPETRQDEVARIAAALHEHRVMGRIAFCTCGKWDSRGPVRFEAHASEALYDAGLRAPSLEAARHPEARKCNCDWPGCQGQCHTGDSCPCHPEARVEMVPSRAAGTHGDCTIPGEHYHDRPFARGDWTARESPARHPEAGETDDE